MPQASKAPTQSSTSSQMPSASASAAQSPPHTPKASSWLPSQSQSPSRIPSPPHTPHSSNTLPLQSQSPSGMPAPPHTPHSSNCKHEPSSSVAKASKLHASASVQPATSSPLHTPSPSMSKRTAAPPTHTSHGSSAYTQSELSVSEKNPPLQAAGSVQPDVSSASHTPSPSASFEITMPSTQVSQMPST